MNNKLLLAKIITLLYRESQMKEKSEKSAELGRKVLSFVKLPELNITFDKESNILNGLTRLLYDMVNDPLDHEYELTEMLAQVRMISEGDEALFESFREAIEVELKPNPLKKLCVNLRRTIHNYFRETEATAILAKAYSMVRYDRKAIPDMRVFINQTIALLEPYTQDVLTIDPAIVSSVDFSEPGSVEEVFRAVKKDTDGTGIMRTGWQGINNMLRGGIRRGECIVVGALQHSFKTGFILGLMRHIALYNKPEMIDPTKKPLIALFSFENEMVTNLHILYKTQMELDTGKLLTDEDIARLTVEEMSEFIIRRLGENGFHLKMIRVNPSMWGYMDICNKVLEYESEGYELHALFCDYLPMIQTTGCKQGSIGDDIRDLYRRVRNFCSAKKIAFITPHQLSTDAKQLVRNGQQEFVKEIANKGYYDGCKRLDQEVDLEIYLHKEMYNGRAYLTVQRGKHRTVVGQTPQEFLYTVLPFEPIGAIPDDVLGVNRSCKKVGGGAIGSGNEQPFHVLDNEMFAIGAMDDWELNAVANMLRDAGKFDLVDSDEVSALFDADDLVCESYS